MKTKKLRNLITPTSIVTIVCLIYTLSILINSAGNPLAFVLLGTQFSQGDPHGSEGYDGQFAYQIALNPLEAAPYLDVPAYRYQRVLYPFLVRVLAFGQAGLIPWALILVNLAAIGLGTWGVESILVNLRVSRWYALIYGLYGGQLAALRTDLNEPLAYALVIGAIWAWSRERRVWAIVAFGLAALAKETSLIFLAAYVLYALKMRWWRWAMGLTLGGVGPFMVYQGLLWAWLGHFGVGSGGAGATPFSWIPLGGWLTIARVHLGAFLLISLVVAPMSIWPALAGVWLSVRRLWPGDVHPFVYSLLLNSLAILFLPTSTFREPLAMLRLTQGVVVSMLLYGSLTRSWRILNYSFLWLFTNVLLVNGVAGAG